MVRDKSDNEIRCADSNSTVSHDRLQLKSAGIDIRVFGEHKVSESLCNATIYAAACMDVCGRRKAGSECHKGGANAVELRLAYDSISDLLAIDNPMAC